MPRKARLQSVCVRFRALGRQWTHGRRHGEQNTSVRPLPQRRATGSQSAVAAIGRHDNLASNCAACSGCFIDLRFRLVMTPSNEPIRLAQRESSDDLESVAAQCAESLRLDPDSVPSLMRLGPILHRLGRYDAAIDALSRAVALEPSL